MLRFPGFTVPGALAPVPRGAAFSVRPQSIGMFKLRTGQLAGGGGGCRAVVMERAYLGEYWDYVVAVAGGGAGLKVSTPPLEVWGVGDAVWLLIDPGQAAAVPGVGG